tara:strand:- start:124 stop:687 length:564 start_codon:yes stop_codon:yes gene_type:complete
MLKVFVWILAAVPGLDIFFLAVFEKLGPNPQETLLRHLGTWTLVLLILTYSLPILVKFGTSKILSCRRMLGLWTFFYGCLHFLAFLFFENEMNFSSFMKDFASRPFVTFGVFAFFLLIPLALTSNMFSISLLGKYWKKIHWLINPVIVLSIIHYFLHRAGKNDYTEPFIALSTVVFVLLIKKFFIRN